MIREYRTIEEVAGPLMLVRQVEGVKYDELGEIELPNGEVRRCRVLEVNGRDVLVQLFDSAAGLNLAESKVRFTGHGVELPVSEHMLGRVFNGMGEVIDNGPSILPEKSLDIPHQPRRPLLPLRVHSDGYIHHRRTEHAGARAETAHLLRLRSAARQPCRPDCAAGKGARLRQPLCRRVRRYRHYL